MGHRSCSSFFGMVLLLGSVSFFSGSSFGRDIPCEEYSAFKKPTLISRVSSVILKRRSSLGKYSKSNSTKNSNNNSNNESEDRRPSDSQSSATSPTHSVQGSPRHPHPAVVDDEEWAVQVESTEDSDDDALEPCNPDQGGPLSQVAEKTLLAAKGAVTVDDKQDQYKKALYLKILTALTKRGRKLNDIRMEYRQGIQYPDLWACVISALGGNKPTESKMDTTKKVDFSSIYNDLISDRADGVSIDLGTGPTTLGQYYIKKGGFTQLFTGKGDPDEKKREIFLDLVNAMAKKLAETKANVKGVEHLEFKDYRESLKGLNQDDPYVKLSLGLLYSASQNTLNTYVLPVSIGGKGPNLPHGVKAPLSFNIQLEKEPYVRGSGIIPFAGKHREPVEDRIFSVTPKFTKEGLAFDHTEAVIK